MIAEIDNGLDIQGINVSKHGCQRITVAMNVSNNRKAFE
jgi:hypothetical protein